MRAQLVFRARTTTETKKLFDILVYKCAIRIIGSDTFSEMAKLFVHSSPSYMKPEKNNPGDRKNVTLSDGSGSIDRSIDEKEPISLGSTTEMVGG